MNATVESQLGTGAAVLGRAADVAAQWRLVDEIQRQWETGGTPDAQAALRSREGAAWDKSVVLQLAIREFHLRRQAGESVDVPSFCRKFPDYASSLSPCLEARDAFAELLHPIDWPQGGDVLCGLTVIEELGRGAFARAYLTRDPACGGRLTVLKLSPDGAREAATLGKLDDPNVVYVQSAVDCPERGLSGLTTPYHGRATLCDLLDAAFKSDSPPPAGTTVLQAAARIKASVPPEPRAVDPHYRLAKRSYETAVLHLARRLSGALEAAHRQEVLHLDLKPSNVLLTPAGEPMLLDFNLSVDSAAPRGPFGGTLPYMAPEMLRATLLDEPVKVDQRADVFSLGVVLYQLLCGDLPFEASPAQTTQADQARHLLARQQQGPRSRSSKRIPASVRRLLAKCLAFEPEHRFATAAELSAALDRELSPWGVAKRWNSTNPHRVWAAAAVVMISFASLGAVNSLRDPPEVVAFKKGVAELREGDYVAADESFSASVAIRPDHEESWFLRGVARQRLGRRIEAIKDFRAAHELAPRDGRVLACAGYCFAAEDVLESAEQSLQQALAEGFDNAALRSDLGFVLLRRSKSDEAMRELDEALRLDPDLSPALHSRAVLHMRFAQSAKQEAIKREHLAAGEADIRHSLKTGPKRGEKYRLLANLLNYGINQKTPDPQAIDELFVQLNLAGDHGFDLHKLANEGFGHLAKDARFAELVARPVQNAQLAEADRLLDPMLFQ